MNFAVCMYKKKQIAFSAVLALIMILFIMFCAYIFKTPYIANDYLDTPEVTILQSKPVNNTDFINSQLVGGLFKYNPEIKERQAVNLPSNKIMLGSKLDPQYLPYEVFNLTSPVLFKAASWTNQSRVRYDNLEQEFLNKNMAELSNQLLAGHYFHHQNAVYGVMNQYELGVAQNQIVFLYGWGNAVLLTKLTHLLGGLNLQNYVHAMYSFYLVYGLLSILLAFFIFRNPWYVLLFSLLVLFSLQAVGFESIRFAPGFNPLRHFLDLFVLLSVFMHFKSQPRHLAWLVTAFLFSYAAILFSSDFGIFLFLALWATVFLFDFLPSPRKWLKALFLLLSFLFFMIILHFLPGAHDPLFKYMLLGVSVPAVSTKLILFLLISISCVYFYLTKLAKQKGPEYYAIWFLFLYAQACLIYFIWYDNYAHFFSLGTIYAFLLVLMLKQVLLDFPGAALKKEMILVSLNLLVFFLMYVPSLVNYVRDAQNYHAIFQSHKVYAWDFPRAKFKSTMDPALFQSAVSLLQAYAKNQNGIYIISKYDNFLPFLAGKYSQLPYLELGLSLVTQDEVNAAEAVIHKNKPLYIFVDSDINRPRFGDTYTANDSFAKKTRLYDMSLGRVQVLQTITKVFDGISKCYVPKQQTGLITVYERKPSCA